MVSELPSNMDVICLQEMFNEEAWEIMNSKLANAGFNYFLFDPQEHIIKDRVTNLEKIHIFLYFKK